MKLPSPKAALQALDAAMNIDDDSTPGTLRPHYAAFRDKHKRFAEDERIVGYGYLENGSYFKREKGSSCIAFYTDQDHNAAQLADRIPQSMRLPGGSTDVPVEIVNIGQVAPLSFAGRVRPAQPGVSISHLNMNSGTLGAVVRKKQGTDEAAYVLSCNHVLTEYNRKPGGDAIIQPGKSDSGTARDKIGELAEIIEIIYRDRDYINNADAALAKISDPAFVNSQLMFASRKMVASQAMRRGTKVWMVGRTSGRSVGEITDPSARIRLKYPRGPRSTAWACFSDVVLCTPFTRGGDSGAAVLTDDNKMLGLVMAGGDRASIFCKMSYISKLLDVELV